ncbi:Pathogenesis-related thaumatin superfamily protein [Abeliophyllum distichum]|uniref:Pathogenesis-related thaumatin superfamily protein n=1 Tax=Abeliophyllum distichum TaxID=126358 RepID=A0ABD1RGW8_9LAMI
MVMHLLGKFVAFFLFLIWNLGSSGNSVAQSCTFYVTNKCPFPIWPATVANHGHPVLAKGGFNLAQGKTRQFSCPGDWSGRIWARTACNFSSGLKPACETGDCNGLLECNGVVGVPPATLVEFALQLNKSPPSFYDVSLVDGYNLPVSVATTPSMKKCRIGGCSKNLKTRCPSELQVVNKKGEVVACKSACLRFNRDQYCCRNEYGSPEKCKPNMYSKLFKDSCPSYVSYAFDTPSPLVVCDSDMYNITFCPDKWGSQHVSE